MRMTQLSGLDLNLLVVADRLLETASVTRTAREVHLSQPAVSRALGRLRVQLGDPLLVREGHRLVPTPYARALRPRLRAALREVERVVFEPAAFDPRQASGRVVIGAADYAAVAFLSASARLLREQAPAVELVNVSYREPFEPLLESGEVDLIVAPRLSKQPWIRSERVLETGWACATRRGHPWAKRPTLAGFCAAEHLMVSPTGVGGGLVDAALAAIGKKRFVRLRVPSFAGALALAAQSDMVLVAPALLVERAARVMHITTTPLPRQLDLRPDSAYMCWHAARDRDPRHLWLLGLVRQVVNS